MPVPAIESGQKATRGGEERRRRWGSSEKNEKHSRSEAKIIKKTNSLGSGMLPRKTVNTVRESSRGDIRGGAA